MLHAKEIHEERKLGRKRSQGAMKVLTIALLIAWFSCLPGMAQEKEPEAAPKAEPAKAATAYRLTKSEIASFEKLLTTAEVSEKTAGGASLIQAIEQHREKKKTDPLEDDQAWQQMLERVRTKGYGEKRVSGAGNLKDESILVNHKGENVLFEYSFRLPSKYTHKKSWPLLLCLHDEMKKPNGKNYLKKVWEVKTKDGKALVDQFILVAPNLGDKTAAGSRGGKKSQRPVRKRLDWFNYFHLSAIIRPLVVMRDTYNVDSNKIFVEGVGTGADTALQLAAISGGQFAGVISRHGFFRKIELAPGLAETAALFLRREGGIWDQAPKNAIYSELQTVAQKEGIAGFQFTTESPLDKLTTKLRADQDQDPLISSNEKVTDFILKSTMTPYPKKLRLATNNASLRHPMIVFNGHEISDEKPLQATVKYDREKNRIDVDGSDNFWQFTLFLNDSIIDLGRPVDVFVNGVQADRRVLSRDPRFMLKNMRQARFSTNRVFTAYMSIDVPEKDEKKDDKPAKDDNEDTKKSEENK